MGRYMLNTAFVTFCVVIGQILTSMMGGYAFARINFPGRDMLFRIYLGTIMIPFVVIMIPIYKMMQVFGWLDQFQSLIIPWVFTAAGTFLFRQFFKSIPKDLEEAAIIDGANRWTILWRIFAPLSVPAIATQATISFLYAWNSFIWPLVAIQSKDQLCGDAGPGRHPGRLSRFPTDHYGRGNAGHSTDGAGFPARPTLLYRGCGHHRHEELTRTLIPFRITGCMLWFAAIGPSPGGRSDGDRCGEEFNSCTYANKRHNRGLATRLEVSDENDNGEYRFMATRSRFRKPESRSNGRTCFVKKFNYDPNEKYEPELGGQCLSGLALRPAGNRAQESRVIRSTGRESGDLQHDPHGFWALSHCHGRRFLCTRHGISAILARSAGDPGITTDVINRCNTNYSECSRFSQRSRLFNKYIWESVTTGEPTLPGSVGILERLDPGLAVALPENQCQRLQDERAVPEPVRGAAFRDAYSDLPYVDLHGSGRRWNDQCCGYDV